MRRGTKQVRSMEKKSEVLHSAFGTTITISYCLVEDWV